MSRSPEPDLLALEADRRVIWHEDVLRFGDTDANGHINNSAYSFFCESGRVNYLDAVIRPTQTQGGFFVIARLVIEFRAEVHYPGRVRSGTWIGAIGRSSVTFLQALFDDSRRLVATSEAVTVAMDSGTRRPAPHGPDTLAKLGPMLRG